MWKLPERKVNLEFILNPFYLYCLAFSLSIFVYLWGWSSIFPQLSISLILFFSLSFLFFIFAGYIFGKQKFLTLTHHSFSSYINDIIFGLIILLGLTNVIFMGYLPILDRLHNYKEFGMPVVDPVFNTMSIFFSVFFFHSYLENNKKRFLIYVFILLIIQILIFRRSTIVWIICSSSFLFLLYKRKISSIIILVSIVCIPLLSYCFGFYGDLRSSLTKPMIINSLGASDNFKKSKISYNHYMTYLYVSSPLANLQKNIDEGDGFLNNSDIKDFFFYSLVPVSLTIRLEKSLNLNKPVCNLISPELSVGSFYMISFYSLGWPGMIIMLLFLFLFIVFCLFITKKWVTFSITTYSILLTTVSLLIFTNFLNRLDVILMLFIYPVLFHFLYIRCNRVSRFSFHNLLKMKL